MEEQKLCVVLNSRQQLHPSRKSIWVVKTQEAVAFLRENDLGLISSIGMPTWELLTALGGIYGLPMSLIIPAETEERFAQRCLETVTQFDLDHERVSFVPCENSSTARDRMAVERAGMIIPVSIRSGGILEELLAEFSEPPRVIEERFEVRYRQRTSSLSYSLEGIALNPELYQLQERYLIHWTRATNLPWPDETKIDYYRAILNSDRYPRLAIDCLNRIVSTRKIIATAKHMPRATRTVSFSDAPPQEVVKLVRWRARQRQMSFEPYGIGIERKLAEDLGIKPVVYYDRSGQFQDTKIEPWLLQSQGSVSDWREEKEARSLGDFDLSGIPNEKLLLFCLTKEEGKELEARHRIRAISFLP